MFAVLLLVLQKYTDAPNKIRLPSVNKVNPAILSVLINFIYLLSKINNKAVDRITPTSPTLYF